MGILNAMLCFQTDPFDIVFPGHRVFHRADRDMDSIAIHMVNREMLFSGCFPCARCNSLHFLAAAIYRNAFVPYQGDNIAAMLANTEFLFRKKSPPSM